MAKLARLDIDIGARLARLETDMKRANRIAERNARKMERAFQSAARGIKIAVGAVATGAVAVLGKKAVDTADKVGKLSQRLGMTTNSLSELQFVAERSGVRVEQLNMGLQRMTRRVSEAAQGTGEAKDAIKELGLDAQRLASMSPDQQFEAIAEALSNVSDQSDKVRLAFKLFDSEGVGLLQAMENGAEGIRELREEARRLGASIGPEMAQNAAQFNDMVSNLKAQLFGAAQAIAADVLPPLNEFLRKLQDSEAVRMFGEVVGLVVRNLDKFAIVLGSVVAANMLASFAVGIQSATVSLTALRLAFINVLGPVGWVAAAAGALAVVLLELSEHSDEFSESSVTAYDALRRFNDELARGNVIAAERQLSQLKDELTKLEGELTKSSKALQTFLAGGEGRTSAAVAQDLANAVEEQAHTVRSATKLYKDAEKRLEELKDQQENTEAATSKNTKAVKNLDAAYKSVVQALDPLTAAELKHAETRETLTDLLEAEKITREEYNKLLESEKQRHQGVIEKLDGTRDAMESTRKEAERLKRETEHNAKAWKALKVELGLVTRAEAEFSRIQAELNRLFNAGALGLVEYMHALELARQKTKEMGETSRQTGEQVGAVWEGTTHRIESEFTGLIDGLIDGTLDIKDAFAQMAQNIVKEWLSAMVKNSDAFSGFMDAIRNGNGGGIGGFFGTDGSGGFNFGADFGGVLGAGLAGFGFGSLLGGNGGVGGALGGIASIFLDSISFGLGTLIGGVIGSLFGHDDPEVRDVRRNISFGANGASINQFANIHQSGRLFSSDRNYQEQLEVDQAAIDALDAFYDAMIDSLQQMARRFGTEVPDLLDAEFRQVMDENGNVLREFGEILGRRWAESFEEFQQRVLAENLLQGLEQAWDVLVEGRLAAIGTGGAIGSGTGTQPPGGDGRQDFLNPNDGVMPPGNTGTLGPLEEMNELQLIAERWRTDATLLLEGVEFLVTAVDHLNNGFNLLGDATLTHLTDVVEELNQHGETLSQTYQRLVAVSSLVDEALEFVGQTFEGTREEFVRFSAEMANAAGGVGQLQGLWRQYFDMFYDEQERLERQVASLENNAAAELGDVGLGLDTTMEEFRQLFEEALPTLSAEEVVQWLEAAEALGLLTDATEELNRVLGQTGEQTAEQAAELEEFMSGIQAGIDELTLSDFQLALQEVEQWLAEATAQAIALGASQEDLAQIQELAALRVQDAIKGLESVINGLISNIGIEGGGEDGDIAGQRSALRSRINDIDSQLRTLAQNEQARINEINRLQEQRYAAELQAINAIKGTVESLLLDESVTTLTPAEQLEEARRQFDKLFSSALTKDGSVADTDALKKLPQAGKQLLEVARFFFASGSEYQAIFDDVTNRLKQAEGAFANPPKKAQFSDEVTAQIQALQAMREELSAQLQALGEGGPSEEQQTTVIELLEALVEWADHFPELDIWDALENFDIPLSQLLDAFGVNFETLPGVEQLIEFAEHLGVSLAELIEHIDGGLIGIVQDLTEALDPEELGHAIDMLIANLTNDELGGLLPSLVEALTDEQLPLVLPLLIAALTDDQLFLLLPGIVDALSDERLELVLPTLIEALTDEQLPLLLPGIINSLTDERLDSLLPGIIEALTDEQLPLVLPAIFEALAPEQLSIAVLSLIDSLTDETLPTLLPAIFEALNPEQLEALLPAIIEALDPTLLDEMLLALIAGIDGGTREVIAQLDALAEIIGNEQMRAVVEELIASLDKDSEIRQVLRDWLYQVSRVSDATKPLVLDLVSAGKELRRAGQQLIDLDPGHRIPEQPPNDRFEEHIERLARRVESALRETKDAQVRATHDLADTVRAGNTAGVGQF